jgi:spore coat protein A
MGPAERYDVLVDFGALGAGETVELRNDERVPLQAAQLLERTMPLFCRFRATSGTGFRGRVPSRLRGDSHQPPVLAQPARPSLTRNLTIFQRIDPTRIPPAFMTLNNLRFTDPQIEEPRQGTYEMWNLINVSTDPHIIHVHLVNFRVLERQRIFPGLYRRAHPRPAVGTKWNPSAERFRRGGAESVPAHEQGWKDTVIVNPGSITRVAIRWPTADELGFDPDAEFAPQGATARKVLAVPAGTGHGGHDMTMTAGATSLRGYMWHCHMLDHEDHDMMLRFRTVKGTTS